MTTHFSNGVTNVEEKMEILLYLVVSNNLLLLVVMVKKSLIKMTFDLQLIRLDVTSGGGSDYQLVDYAGGWLRLGDDAPGRRRNLQVFLVKKSGITTLRKQWWYETRIAVTDVSELNFFVGFADNAFVDPADTLPTDCIGFSHLEDTTSIQFLSRKNAAGTSFDMTDTAGGSTFAMLDSSVPTQTATQLEIPSNSVRLGFHLSTRRY